jgi:hypothetical protein
MKKYVFIGFVVAITFCFLFPAMADTLTLKSGKSLEGKIIDETDTYVIIQYAGIPLKYWKEDIAQIEKSTDTKHQKFYSVRSASKEGDTVKITIKEDPAQGIAAYIKTLDALRSDVTKTVFDAQNQLLTNSDGQITEADRKLLKETVDSIEKKIAETKKVHVPSDCKILQLYALDTAEAETKRFAGTVDTFITIKELKDYWKQYSQVTLQEIGKKYDDEKQRICRQYYIEPSNAS